MRTLGRLLESKIAAHGKPMSASQLKSARNFGAAKKEVHVRPRHEIEAEMAKIAVEADSKKDARGAWPKHLMRKHDKLRTERSSIKESTRTLGRLLEAKFDVGKSHHAEAFEKIGYKHVADHRGSQRFATHVFKSTGKGGHDWAKLHKTLQDHDFKPSGPATWKKGRDKVHAADDGHLYHHRHVPKIVKEAK